jgi:endonuclease/exonuclease/phosphatase family metal-dependent hydrolase
MFDRAKAFNNEDWKEGRPALDAHRELNDLFNKPVYGAADKKRILTLLKQQGLLKKDDGGRYLLLRIIRGKLLLRPKNGAVSVVADGRSDWIGWIELKMEPVREAATQNIARVIDAVGADVIGVIEAEDRTTLCLFNQHVFGGLDLPGYDHIMLIDGNDERGIDVGILTRGNHPIQSIRSHVDARDAGGVVFSRDCAEYEIRTPSGATVWVLLNHLKSKGYGKAAQNDAKRKRQATYVRALYDQHIGAGHSNVVVMGDFNDTPGNEALAPLLADGSTLKDISQHPGFSDGGRPGTYGNCTASNKIDYILLSPALFAVVASSGVERRGMWGGKNGTLWPHFPQVKSDKEAASDHAALWVDLNV